MFYLQLLTFVRAIPSFKVILTDEITQTLSSATLVKQTMTLRDVFFGSFINFKPY